MSSADSETGLNWVHSPSAWAIAGIGAFIGISISLYNIIKHITFYTLPEQQLHIIRILLIVPLYAVVSWLSMGFTDFALYFESVRDIYEAFVIYCFLVLILGYVGGEANCVALISLKDPLKHPWPLCCLPSMDLNVKFLRFCKQSCIQFIIIKPIMAVLNIIMLATGNVNSLGYQIFANTVYNIAYTLALYGLLLFYLACKSDIRAYSPVRKFFAVKIVIFATYWQSLIVSFAPGIGKETADLWNDFILCLEMSIFAIIHLYSFPWWEFRTGMPSSKELVAQNAKKVLSIKDVVRDVYHNVAPAYQTYVLQTDDGTVKQYKTKTYMVGNLNDPKVHNKFMPDMNGLRKKYGNNNGKFERGFGHKKNYIQHTDDYDDSQYGPEATETEIDYDPRMVHHANNSTNDDTESHDTQPEESSNDKLALAVNKKLVKRITPEIDYDDDDEDDEEEEEDDDEEIEENGCRGVHNAENDENSTNKLFDDFGDLNDFNDMKSKSKSNSKSFPTPDSKTNLINININGHNDKGNDGDNELSDFGVHIT